MQRQNNKSPFVNLPSDDEVAAFDPTSGRECCTADHFSYDIRLRPSSHWNRSAARVFAADFGQHYPQFGKSEDEIVHAWKKHTETLRRQFASLEQQDIQAAYQRSIHRQRERKRQVGTRHCQLAVTFSLPLSNQLFQRRRTLTMAYLTPADTELLDALGVHGMSSDESDHEAGNGEPTYIIRSKQWCSPELQDWLRTLDSLHIALRYKTHFDVTQGGWPHYRVAGRKVSSRAPVQGLPLNCYSTSLLESYDSLRTSWLRPMTNAEANLKHSPEVLECVLSTYHRISGGPDKLLQYASQAG